MRDVKGDGRGRQECGDEAGDDAAGWSPMTV
jgi:hypothetical protein